MPAGFHGAFSAAGRGCGGAAGVAARRPAPALPCVAGLLALAAGALVYLADRDPARVMALPAFAALAVGPLFGAAGGWLPSFVHPFAFSLFSAAARPRAARPAYGACLFWWAANVAFECVQWPPLRDALAAALPSGTDAFAPARWLARFAQQGRFDIADLLAVSAGALAAAGLLHFLNRTETDHAL